MKYMYKYDKIPAPLDDRQHEAWGRGAESSAGWACTMLSFAEKTHVEENPASIHIAEGNPGNCLNATFNHEIGG